MSDRTSPSATGTGDGATAASPERLPYETPQITFREPLETLAAVCTPSPPAKSTPVACPQGPVSS